MSGNYRATIGLEIHAELKTQTKMFCDSRNDPFASEANMNICPVCLAHPGTLPVINFDAVRHVLRVGVALGATLADYTEFDRKNYFYPDLPKGYQLSQYEYPLVSGGSLNGVSITRVHLEEDTASSIHDTSNDATLIDYNRAGVPLMELVTDPVIRTAEEAGNFAKELQLLLRYLEVSDADMEKGHMRLEANISVSNSDMLGTKVEVKNINSFRAMERAIVYEIERQSRLLENGGAIEQETRGWDEGRQATFSQRVKEGSADYRYFPDPDLPSLKLTEIPDFDVSVLKGSLPVLPWQKREQYTRHGIKSDDIELYVKIPTIAKFLDEVIALQSSDAEKIRLSSNYIANDIMNHIKAKSGSDVLDVSLIKISPKHFSNLIDLLIKKKISSRSGKDLLAACIVTDQDPAIVAAEKNLFQENVSLDSVIIEVLAHNPQVVADFKSGKVAALEFLVGQCMKKMRGAADPEQLRIEIRKKIG